MAQLFSLGHMRLKLNVPIAAAIAYLHLCMGLITSMLAAGQADSLGQPHGYGWIISAHIVVFPLWIVGDFLQQHFSIPDWLALTALVLQSACWGVIITLMFSWKRKRKSESHLA